MTTNPDQIAENDRPDPMDTPDLSTDIAAAEEVTARFRKPARPAESDRLLKDEGSDIVDEVEPTHRGFPVAQYTALQNLRSVVAYVLGRQTSDSPCNDEPEALTGDGYLYWMLRHAYEATRIDGDVTP